jgi:hypothetical protein
MSWEFLGEPNTWAFWASFLAVAGISTVFLIMGGLLLILITNGAILKLFNIHIEGF